MASHNDSTIIVVYDISAWVHKDIVVDTDHHYVKIQAADVLSIKRVKGVQDDGND